MNQSALVLIARAGSEPPQCPKGNKATRVGEPTARGSFGAPGRGCNRGKHPLTELQVAVTPVLIAVAME